MNKKIEDSLSKELVHIFSVFTCFTWPRNIKNYDEKVRYIKVELRKGNGPRYLSYLNTMVDDENYEYKDFHKLYVKGVRELLCKSIKFNILEGSLASVDKVVPDNKFNIFTLDGNKNILLRLKKYNKTIISYSNVLKYGIERIQKDLREYYPNAEVCLSREYYQPDFIKEQYIYHGVKYMIVWPIMPAVILWNGQPGIMNHTIGERR